jgi:hypothetical protein
MAGPTAAPAQAGPPEMTLLRAADLLAAPPHRDVRPTIESLGGAGTDAVPRGAFLLIAALDLPGGYVPQRAAPAPAPAAAPEPEPEPPPPPPVLAAAAVPLPLAELFRLLADGSAEDFAGLHEPAA